MRKVNLTMKEEMMYDIIKAECLGKVSKQFAANKLNVTRRTINRRINDYKLNGKEAFSHKNKTRTSPFLTFNERATRKIYARIIRGRKATT